MLGWSGLYHCGNWTYAQEAFLGKLDLSGIHLQVAFSMAPFYGLLLPDGLGWYVLSALGTLAVIGSLIALSGVEVGRHTMSAVYIGTASLQLVPMASCLLDEQSIWAQTTSAERTLIRIAAGLYLGGSQVYAYTWPSPWPHTFGYHEIWHICVVLASACTYLCNASLLMRLNGAG